MFTFSFGGALFALGLIFHGDVTKALTTPVVNLPVGFIIAGGYLIFIIAKAASLKLKRVRDVKVNIARAEIDIFGRTVSGSAFLDTGNRLYDSDTGLPVIVLSCRASLAVLGDGGLSALLRDKIKEISPFARYISYKGAGGQKSRVLLLKPDALRFYTGQDPHTIKDVVIGLSMSGFSDAVSYDMILHPAVFSA
jgi:sigma-E processing peptidase SpoIIGA